MSILPSPPDTVRAGAAGATPGSPLGPSGVLALRAGGTALLLDCTGDRLPRVLHWGEDLGDLDDAALADLRLAAEPGLASGQADVVVPLSLVAEQSAGWMGTPGLTGHREGRDFSTAFLVTALTHERPAGDPSVAHRVRVDARDETAGLALGLDVELLHPGLVRLRAEVTNVVEGLFDLATLDVNLPVPLTSDEILDLTGRHLRERTPQRHAFTLGTHLRESRRSRGHDASLLLAAGERGFGWRGGEVRAVHVAWHGNTRTYAERTNLGTGLLAGGELLLAGEIRLATGDSYRGPWVYGSAADGLDAMSARFHGYLRSRPHHPRSPRPVLINVWEAVYFDHRLDRLVALADLAASVGVERYVLDDGWFSSRRDDTSGLGDWTVSDEVWPDGLGPLVDHVHGLGMQFGLWFEPEMVNPDSDVARAHPEWMLAAGERLPVPARHQQVLDLTHPGAYAHVRDQLLAVLDAYRIDYVKWDHNRDLVEPGHRPTGRPVAHAQAGAVLRLLAEIRAAHPHLEIESCSGGGGRADLGILELTDRIWTSDDIDPLERQQIEAYTSLLLPPELMGSHIASPISHSTGRGHSLDLRAGTAFFSHLGIEWDLTSASPEELDRLRLWVAAHQRHRDLLHTGTVVHDERPDGSAWLRGVVAPDRSEAVYTVVALTTSPVYPPGQFRLPGLDPDALYDVRPLPPGDVVGGRTSQAGATPPWWTRGVTLPGSVLARVGVQAPGLHPEQMVLLHVTRVTPATEEPS
ncbi:alpha-galactosidase [Cellulomonas marina]|uniref:Alpha-galactosidase n=1 Tax=Cellulomonas marina TaxID=988821 RepID=A0A1I0WR20_9CELL|nr:alpha-galactosidase [Cellulomonas marina]GIG27794.1 alpha-galactosidase [Cellulomonas marina]SFA90638.1 alpha-galactosidase [Cellulomonas marina]